ncbi:MAG TPA: DUF1015 domain-containing protein, partial [Phycisphaerales bacterium]|nr:DUF1015 domain-containing protein [Phycisphaerales bacterium]
DFASEVACVPYDVVNTAEARELAAGKPRSFMHVIRSEIDLPVSTNPYDDAVYEKAVENYESFKRDGTLVHEKAPSIYIYRLKTTLLGKPVVQTGVAACCSIDDYTFSTNGATTSGGGAGAPHGHDLIKKHETTRKDKEDDRTRHVLDMKANAEPVFLMYRDDAGLAALMNEAIKAAPLYDFTARDGVTHTIWRVADPQPFVHAFQAVPHCYVADGHHRTASAARAGARLRAENPGHTGAEEYNWFLSVLFPASELTILPYHRTVADLNSLTPGAFVEKLRAVGRVSEKTGPNPSSSGSFNVYVAGNWYAVSFAPESIDRADPVASLDCELLSQRVLAPILGINDLRTDKRIDFVGGIRGTNELKKRVDSGQAAAAFSMYPTTIPQLIAVADAGRIMPPKSTWFEPKLRSGLLIHELN